MPSRCMSPTTPTTVIHGFSIRLIGESESLTQWVLDWPESGATMVALIMAIRGPVALSRSVKKTSLATMALLKPESNRG